MDASKEKLRPYQPFLPTAFLTVILVLNVVFVIYYTPWKMLMNKKNTIMRWEDILQPRRRQTSEAEVRDPTTGIKTKITKANSFTSGIKTEKFRTIGVE